ERVRKSASSRSEWVNDAPTVSSSARASARPRSTPAWKARSISSAEGPGGGAAAASGAAAAGGGPKGPKTFGTASASGAKLDDDIALARAERDPLLGIEAARRRHDAGLRLLDVLQADRPHQAHVLLEDLHRALREVAEQLLAHGRARGLERQHEVVARDLLEQHLHAAVVEAEQVLEGEHQPADGLGHLRRARLQVREDARLDRLVGDVQDVRGQLGAEGAGARCCPPEALD